MPSRRDFIEGSVAALALAAVGCGDDDGMTGVDSGTRDSGGTDSAVPPDTGGMDAGGMDSGVDAGGTDSGTDAGDMDTGSMMCVNITFVVGTDHPRPHAEGISFPADHVAMGVEQTYDITGASAHPHTLVVTPADFAALARGETVTITSSRDGSRPHTHDVMLTCEFS